MYYVCVRERERDLVSIVNDDVAWFLIKDMSLELIKADCIFFLVLI